MLAATNSPQVTTTVVLPPLRGLVRNPVFHPVEICATCLEPWTHKTRISLADDQPARKGLLLPPLDHNDGKC